MVLLQANKISRISQSSETPIFADAIVLTSTGLSRPTQIQRPDFAVGTYDLFQGRHGKRGLGNVGFYDGHVAAVVAQVRPANTYGTSPSQLYNAQQLHLGPLCPQTIDFSQIPDSSTYSALCKSTFNYYFWVNKRTKSLN
jgi:prepilin-type processing-associated H-X9-DG protein